MSFNELLKFIHVLAAIAWVGGSVGVMAHAIRVMGPKGSDGNRIDFFRQADLMGRVFMISAVVAAASGTWLVIRIEAWGFDQFWISFAFAVFIASAALGMFFFTPQSRKAIAVGEEQGTNNATFQAISRRIGQVSTVETLFLIAVVWAMVVKPGA